MLPTLGLNLKTEAGHTTIIVQEVKEPAGEMGTKAGLMVELDVVEGRKLGSHDPECH